MHFVNFPFSIFTFCICISHFAHFYVVYFAKLLKNISTLAFTYSLCGESCYRLGIHSPFLFFFSFSLFLSISPSLFLCVHSSGSLLCVLWNVCYVRLLWNLHKMQMMPTEQSTPAATAAAAEGKRKSGKDGKALPVLLLVSLWLFWSFAISYLLKGLLVLHWHILLVFLVRTGTLLPFLFPFPTFLPHANEQRLPFVSVSPSTSSALSLSFYKKEIC